MSLTNDERSELRMRAEDYANALAQFKLAERKHDEARARYVDYVNSLRNDKPKDTNP